MGWLQKYFVLNGRLTPLQYWRFQVRLGLAAVIVISATTVATVAGGWLGAIPFLFALPVLASGVSVTIRRLHDRGKSGWWLLFYGAGPGLLAGLAQPWAASEKTLALAGLLVLAALILVAWVWLEIGFLRGQKGPNRFGADSRAA
jgi:uncharacterized membrane protein YhaH (DUF805 family)